MVPAVQAWARWAPILFLASGELFANPVAGHLIRTSLYRPLARKTHEVVIYYATETAPDGPAADNSRQVAKWLAAIHNPEAGKESKWVLNDLIEFPAVVHGDIAILSGASTRNVLIFSNEMTRRGLYMLGRAGRRPGPARFVCGAPSRDPIRAASPLSSPECLAEALKEAAARFSVSDHDFTVLLNGHGYSERILVPRICVRDTEISQEWLTRVFNGQGSEGARQYRLRYGMSKPELLQVLGGTVPGMSLGLVLLHACHSALPPYAEAPKNIGVLWSYDDGVKYDSVDYSLILRTAGTGSVAETLDAYLIHTQRAAARALLCQQARSVGTKLIWFLPLVLYGAWYALGRRNRLDGSNV